MKTVEELEEVDPVQMGSGYLMCLFEFSKTMDSQLNSDKTIFSFVVSTFMFHLFTNTGV